MKTHIGQETKHELRNDINEKIVLNYKKLDGTFQ